MPPAPAALSYPAGRTVSPPWPCSCARCCIISATSRPTSWVSPGEAGWLSSSRCSTRACAGGPGGYEGEVDHPQPVRGVRREAAVHQVRRPVLRRVRDRRPRLLPPAAAHPAQPQLAHQPLDGAPGRRDALAVQLVPDLPGSVPFAAVLIDAQDLLFQR